MTFRVTPLLLKVLDTDPRGTSIYNIIICMDPGRYIPHYIPTILGFPVWGSHFNPFRYGDYHLIWHDLRSERELLEPDQFVFETVVEPRQQVLLDAQ